MSLKSSTNTEVNTYELVLEISPEAFDKAVNTVYNRQKANIAVKGFRKGKATRKIIENAYGEGVFYDDALNAILPAEIDSAVAQEKLDLVDRPAVIDIDIDKEKGVTVKVSCTTRPVVSIEGYKGIEAHKGVKPITDADVDAQIESLRTKQARIISVDDRPAQLNDEVTMDFEGFMDGVAFDGGKGDDFPLTLGSGQFIPGFEDQIVGHGIGEEFEINVTFPENYQMEELAGKPATFKIKIKNISVQELPEVDDDFVKETTEFDTVAEMREDIKKKLVEGAEHNAEHTFEDEIFHTLIDKVEGEIPECMYDRRIDALIEEFDQRLRTQGMTLDKYMQYTGMDMDSLKDTYMDRAIEEVKLRLALEKIAEIEGFEVSDEELNKSLEEMAASYNMDVEMVKRFISPEDYRKDLLVTKAADFVKDNAVVIEAEKTEETAE